MEAECSPEEVGLSSAGLRLAFRAFQQFYERGEVPGGVMTVARKGKVCFAESFGYRDVASGDKMRADCIFNIASMTKSVTSVACMMLVEQGRLLLDEDICTYLPQLRALKVAAVGGGVVPLAGKMTLRQLLSHTSGFSYSHFYERPDGDPIAASDAACNGRTPLEEVPLAFEPGSHFRYSMATAVVGLAVEKASGQPLAEFFREHIFAPLGMHDTAYAGLAGKEARVATCYMQTDEPFPKGLGLSWKEKELGAAGLGNLQPVSLLDKRALGPESNAKCKGDGGLWSTPADWHKFTQMLIGRGQGRGGGPRLLGEDTFATLVAPATPELNTPADNTHFGDSTACGFNGFSHGKPIHPLVVNFAYGGLAYSLLAEVATSEANAVGASKGATGWEGIFGTKYTVDFAEELTFSIFSQVTPSWRYNYKATVLPLIYRSLLRPNTPHPHAFSAPLVDPKWGAAAAAKL